MSCLWPKIKMFSSLSWPGIAAQNLVSFFTIFRLTKFISSLEFAGAIQVNFLYCPLNSWHFKSANKLVPLYTALFLYNSVCLQRLSHCFLLLDNLWCINMKAALATCKDDIFPIEAANSGGSQPTAHSLQYALSCRNLNHGASRTPHDYVTLLHCSGMLKPVRGPTPTVVRLSDRAWPQGLCLRIVDFISWC